MGLRELDALSGSFSYPTDINSTGQVVGRAEAAEGLQHAFITGPDGMGMRDLGTLGGDWSWAYGINNAGQVVGWADIAGGRHAFITGPDGEGMINLNSLVDLPEGWVLTEATGINNNGQVIAIGGQVIAIGLIPEPKIYALMLAGFGLTAFMARRKEVERSRNSRV